MLRRVPEVSVDAAPSQSSGHSSRNRVKVPPTTIVLAADPVESLFPAKLWISQSRARPGILGIKSFVAAGHLFILHMARLWYVNVLILCFVVVFVFI